MTPLPNDTDLQIAVAKAVVENTWMSEKTIPAETLEYAGRIISKLQKQGFSIGLNTVTTQDHMRKADAAQQLSPGESTRQKMKEYIQSEFGKIKDLTAGVSPSNVFGFGTALDALTIHGKKVARLGWNGKNMFVYYVPANRYSSVTEIAKKEFGEFTQYNAYFAIKNVDGTVSTWVPSINDLLQKDWYVVE